MIVGRMTNKVKWERQPFIVACWTMVVSGLALFVAILLLVVALNYPERWIIVLTAIVGSVSFLFSLLYGLPAFVFVMRDRGNDFSESEARENEMGG